MDNTEIFTLLQKMEGEINGKLDKLFDLIGKADNRMNEMEVQQATMIQQIKALEGKSGNTRANIAIVATVIMFLGWLITIIVGSLK